MKSVRLTGENYFFKNETTQLQYQKHILQRILKSINMILSKLKFQCFLKLKKYTKMNSPLEKFVGDFYWGKVGQDLLLVRLRDRNSCQYGDRQERKPFSWAGRGSEERMVCTRSGH